MKIPRCLQWCHPWICFGGRWYTEAHRGSGPHRKSRLRAFWIPLGELGGQSWTAPWHAARHKMRSQNHVARHKMRSQNRVARQKMKSQNHVARQKMKDHFFGRWLTGAKTLLTYTKKQDPPPKGEKMRSQSSTARRKMRGQKRVVRQKMRRF